MTTMTNRTAMSNEPGLHALEAAEMNAENPESRIIRRTSSLCPVCLKKIPAVLSRDTASDHSDKDNYTGNRYIVFMIKTCPQHGTFKVPVWKDNIDLEGWISREEPLTEREDEFCSGDCRVCLGTGSVNLHGQETCCVILEVTKRCNLRCSYCFAHGGESESQPSYGELCAAIDDIAKKGGGPLIQFSGGEPTLRDDLPDLVRYAGKAGCQYTQINTNGIRLAQDEDYVRGLAEAGLDIVFLQYDGTDDEIYRKLRGRALAQIKLQAIENCGKYRIGVTLVPTIVRGINDHAMGQIIREAVRCFPAVKSVHFQPVTYLGRHPERHPKDGHYTLDELMADLCSQTGIPESALLPSRCDHAMCEFHSTFLVNSKRQLVPMTDRAHDVRRARTPASRNRQYVAEHWRRDRSDTQDEEKTEAENSTAAEAASVKAADPGIPLVVTEKEEMGFDDFVRRMRTQTLKISAMAFQDAMNVDLERLYRCSLHVYEDGELLPFCGKYMTPWKREEDM